MNAPQILTQYLGNPVVLISSIAQLPDLALHLPRKARWLLLLSAG